MSKSSQELSAFVEEELARLPTFLDVTVRDYFATPGKERGRYSEETETINQYGDLSLHELLVGVVTDQIPYEELTFLAETPRDPMNHLHLYYQLYAAAANAFEVVAEAVA